ncbi:hypothetical protein [Verrucomicrobium sp. BvORR106]|uniref:hypothetical protein n=1 Tax=Verrucomicrobium sp. BvORR106 TaxID=1403819 RepID=UPI000571A590|nr:hypothetical protein [Verrucomicrobium sp. BvORR106]
MKTRVPSLGRRLLRLAGFSLPEVTLAVGVASVALMSVVGLLPILLSSDQENGANTTLTTLASQTLARISADWAELPSGAAKPDEYQYYFSQDGEFVNNAGSLMDAKVVYHCLARLEPVTGISANPGNHVRMVRLEFTYNSPARTTKIIQASLNDDL